MDSLKNEVPIDTGLIGDNHRTMTYLICYKTPFILDDSPLIINSRIGDDMSLRAILGLRMILLLYVFFDFDTGTLKHLAINEGFVFTHSTRRSWYTYYGIV